MALLGEKPGGAGWGRQRPLHFLGPRGAMPRPQRESSEDSRVPMTVCNKETGAVVPAPGVGAGLRRPLSVWFCAPSEHVLLPESKLSQRLEL